MKNQTNELDLWSGISRITRLAPRPKQSRGSVKDGFTLIELLVVIAIIALLASMLVVGVKKSLTHAKETKKTAMYRNFHMANYLYSIDHEGNIVPASDNENFPGNGLNWRDILARYIAQEVDSRGEGNEKGAFIDPFFDYNPATKHETGFGINWNPGLPEIPTFNALKDGSGRSFKLHAITHPHSRIFIGDVKSSWLISGNNHLSVLDTTRHRGTGMFLMFDGSTRMLNQAQAITAFTDPETL